MKYPKILLILFTALLVLISSCNNKSLRIFKQQSARSQYVKNLKSSGISSTKVGVEWQNSANLAVQNAIEVKVPVSLKGSFRSKSIEAKAWKIVMEQGSSISILSHWQANDSSQLFMDLLEGPDWKELQSNAIRHDSIKFEANISGEYILRLQPELLGEGNFTIQIYGTPTYAVFPVHGKNSAAIQSIWGDERDGGKRSHEGVDIFAKRGTPVLAPVEGVVTAVRDKGLGGKQVWMRDPHRDWNLYFAHLDTQIVANLQRVKAGDTLGLVGNSGNAKTTVPHLHFGIYENGAINPFPAIEDNFERSAKLEVETLPLLLKVNAPQANMRKEPNLDSDVISTLQANIPVLIKAATSDWYQIQTFDGSEGFIYKDLLSFIDSTKMEIREAYAFSKPSVLSDSLLVNLEDFNSLGIGVEGYTILSDKDGNVYFLPKF